MQLQAVFERTRLGGALIAGTAAGICAVLLGDDESALRDDLRRRFPRAALAEGGEAFRALAAAARAAIEDPEASGKVPLDLHGTSFQQEVWRALCEIPAGRTASYGELAARLGRPRAAQAVGQAVAANPVAVLVPCHRAIRGDGSLSGYRWGVERKRVLLAREAAAAARAAS